MKQDQIFLELISTLKFFTFYNSAWAAVMLIDKLEYLIHTHGISLCVRKKCGSQVILLQVTYEGLFHPWKQQTHSFQFRCWILWCIEWILN